MAKKNEAPKPKDAAKEAVKRAKKQSPNRLGKSIEGRQRVTDSTARLTRQNSRGGKLTLSDKVGLSRVVTAGIVGKPSFKSEGEYRAAQIMQSRRAGETSRTASRAKGIAARQAKVTKAKNRQRSLGN